MEEEIKRMENKINEEIKLKAIKILLDNGYEVVKDDEDEESEIKRAREQVEDFRKFLINSLSFLAGDKEYEEEEIEKKETVEDTIGSGKTPEFNGFTPERLDSMKDRIRHLKNNDDDKKTVKCILEMDLSWWIHAPNSYRVMRRGMLRDADEIISFLREFKLI